MNFDFSIHAYQGRARQGRLTTPHGIIQTPAFIFCATKGAMKALLPSQLHDAGTQFILSNTYHLMVTPGAHYVRERGGLHKFMGWNGPLLTDSGGFQIFSLGHGSVASEIKGKRQTGRTPTLVKITEDGATFKSYLDGSTHHLTPEKSIEIQRDLGVDFMVVLDECTPFHVNKSYTAMSMRRSHRWALRSLANYHDHDNGTQKLYGIIQGGIYPDLRKESADFVNNHPFFGHAVGGSLGASKDQMHDVVGIAMEHLRPDRPVHLLGIGGISDIFNGVAMGIDTFDCVHPTRLARHGGALVLPKDRIDHKEHLTLTNARYKCDDSPIDNACPCYTCRTYSRAYLHYLLKVGEMVAMTAITLHNVTFMNRLMSAIRDGIIHQNLDHVKKEWCG